MIIEKVLTVIFPILFLCMVAIAVRVFLSSDSKTTTIRAFNKMAEKDQIQKAVDKICGQDDNE